MTPEDRAKIASALDLMAAVIPDTNERIGRAYNEAKVLLASADHELSALPPMPVVDIEAVIREVAELPDRTTPIDLYNDHMIVSGNELRSILRAHVIDVSGERAPIDGLETTAEERAFWLRTADRDQGRPLKATEAVCLLRDFGRLAALLAEARAEIENTQGNAAIQIELLIDQLSESCAREARTREDERK